MLSYLKFKELWKAIENDSLNLATYLQDVYWRSMLTESEMRRAAALIADAQKSKNFAEFLAVFDCPVFCFSDMFDRDLIETERWAQRDNAFPRHLKKTYAFMMLTNHLAYGRQQICSRCEEAFLSTNDETYCEYCRPVVERERARYLAEEKATDSATTIRIELICKAE